MEMYDNRTIAYRGRPLFQTAKMRSPATLNNTLQNTACFFYVLKGCNETIEGNGVFKTRKKEGLVKSCGNFISRYVGDEDGSDFEAVVIYFYPDVIREIYKDRLPDFLLDEAKAKPPVPIVGNPLIEKFINGIFIYFENGELMDEELARLKLKELIIILLKSNYFEGVVDFFKGIFASKNTTFREVVERNLFNDLTIEQLAFLTHKSLSSFKRAFKREFNDTPARYIKNRRLEAAAKELLFTERSITDIAFDCGFRDLTTFSASFRDKFDLPPSKYRLNQIRK